jgi:carbonic anhydrase
MQKLVQGIHHFRTNVFPSQRRLFERLSAGQQPQTLFITCSDSRINPNLITHTEPGELFILRNAGNIVPPLGATNGGEAATIEFAVSALGVRDIIVCGHSRCGAVSGLLTHNGLDKLPTVAAWLKQAEATRRIVLDNYADLDGSARLNVAIQENALVQIENLRTHPAVASALSRGELSLYAWVYKFETGEVFAYDSEYGQYIHVAEHSGLPMPSSTRLADVRVI